MDRRRHSRGDLGGRMDWPGASRTSCGHRRAILASGHSRPDRCSRGPGDFSGRNAATGFGSSGGGLRAGTIERVPLRCSCRHGPRAGRPFRNSRTTVRPLRRNVRRWSRRAHRMRAGRRSSCAGTHFSYDGEGRGRPLTQQLHRHPRSPDGGRPHGSRFTSRRRTSIGSVPTS